MNCSGGEGCLILIIPYIPILTVLGLFGLSMTSMFSLLIFKIIIFVGGFIIGFLIGWGIHSLIRKLWSNDGEKY
jgi:hypothetical protein